ncbi:MAG: site-specific integrase [Methylomicrobium sp.]|nr:site-specific integrase [Methylomicrobium sp.]
MTKIPYLYRRKNIFYFRIRVPEHLRNFLQIREVTRSLKTEKRSEATFLALRLASEVTQIFNEIDPSASASSERCKIEALLGKPSIRFNHSNISTETKPPSLSSIIDSFLSKYDPSNRAMLTKLKSFMPIFLELIEDKPVHSILQGDINQFFDDVQKLPVRRKNGVSLRELIANNDGDCISKKTFEGSYRACISIFLEWGKVHYQDQGFPSLSTAGAIYRGIRTGADNKQRAIRPEELIKLFSHSKMKIYASSSDTAHYCWLPLIGLHTGARVNEVCQLNPLEDILQDAETGIWYFYFTDETATAESVVKSIKTNSSRRIVPIHSSLINLGILNYIEHIKADSHKLIFPQWRPRNGKASANACKWFSRYLTDIGLRDEAPGSKLIGFHSFRHTFITHGIQNKIPGVFRISGHETESVDGFGKVSKVAAGYWTRGHADDIAELREIIERFDFGIDFYRPV